MRDLFQNRFLIPSARADWHEYDGGVYFVTICTQNREHYFGEIGKNNNDEPKMELTPIGQFAEEQLRNVTQHYPYAEIPLWVIMPNHMHAIVVIGDANCCCRDAINRVSEPANEGDNRVSAPQNDGDAINRVSTGEINDIGGITGNNNPMLKNCLGAVVRGLKARVTKFANENSIPFAWQTRFFDHIVRNQNEMNSIAEYIENNVAKWESDKFYNNE